MKLFHYTDEKFELEPREYDQYKLFSQSKPNGLWFSIEGDYDWKSWCTNEDFRVENLAFSYEIILKDDANILHLKTADEIIEFGKDNPYVRQPFDDPTGILDTYRLNWTTIKAKYQGIIIAPYQWSCRLNDDCGWYYGWDCASGCLWDLSCIKSFTLLTQEDAHVKELSENS